MRGDARAERAGSWFRTRRVKMTEAGEKRSLKHFSRESGKKDESMTEKHKEWALAAIEQIRQRKARPDFPRLCNTLQRKHGLAKSEIQCVIDQLVHEKTIKKVFFKGQCSYRSTKSSTGNDISPLSTSSRITQGIKSIMKQTGDGVSFKDLENWLIGRNPETKLVKTRLEVALKKEMESNTITKLPDNCYVLTESLPTKQKKEETPVIPRVTPPGKRTSPVEKVESCPNAGIRRPGRPKRKVSRLMTKPTKWMCAQRRLRIRPVWSESSLSAWRQLGFLATHWVQMPGLMWVFTGHNGICLVLSWGGPGVLKEHQSFIIIWTVSREKGH